MVMLSAGVRDPNQQNLDKCIIKVNGNFEADGKRKVLGIISKRVDDLLISGWVGLLNTLIGGRRGDSMLVDMREINRLT